MEHLSDLVRNWRVLHACEAAAPIAAIVEAQLQVGMSPQLLSREYWSPQPNQSVSLLTTWHDVRDWRHVLNEAEVLTSLQIVHAHSFASGMAGVRGSLPVVYDFAATLEQTVDPQPTSGPWLLRSFRVAEQFAISRASAIVVHSLTMQTIAAERGAATSNIFVIPTPFASHELLNDPLWSFNRAIHPDDVVIYALPDPSGHECTLRAFKTLSAELDHATLVLEIEEHGREQIAKLARDLDIAHAIRCINPAERDAAMGCARLVIAPATGDAFGHANQALLRALAGGRAVVAADVPENRECSKEGRGLVWYRSGEPEDLAQRVAFVARNLDFSRSLGTSGRAHIEASRSSKAIGHQYDAVYRHAHSRSSDNIPKIHVPKLYALGTQLG